jgi:hypothetical protein
MKIMDSQTAQRGHNGIKGGERMNKILWYIKQLLPLKYISHYTCKGKKHITKFRMWFGRVISNEDHVID